MRLNVPITALLALALTSLEPATLAATTRPAHRTTTHKSSGPATSAKKHARKKSTDDSAPAKPAPRSRHRRSKKHPTEDAPDPITIERAQATPRRGTIPARENQEAAATEQPGSSLTPSHRKATSDDFLRAAGVSDGNAPAPVSADPTTTNT